MSTASSRHQKDTSSEVAITSKVKSPTNASERSKSTIPMTSYPEAAIPTSTSEPPIPIPTPAVPATPAPTPVVAISNEQLSEDDEAIAQFYRKKLKWGMPSDAVRHKMTQDGVGAKIITAVVGNIGSEPPPAPTPAAVQLTEDEEAIAQFYRKKIKMGMPADAVHHKMIGDGIDARVIAAVMRAGEASPVALPATVPAAVPAIQLSEDDEEFAQFYRKKLKFGMPLDALRRKMTQDGVDAKIISAVVGVDAPAPAPATPSNSEPLTSSSNQLSEDEEAIAQFYRKKLKLGMPPDAVRYKMTRDGVDARIVAAVVGGGDEAATATSTPTPVPVAAPRPLRHRSDLTIEERYLVGPYMKMGRMGMPVDAVKHKMTQDGVDARLILYVTSTISAASASPTTHAPAPVPAPATATPSNSEPLTSSSIQLSDKDEAIAQFYRKKLKMGMPPHLVRQKMTQDAVDARIVAVVVGGGDEAVAATSTPTPVPVAAPQPPQHSSDLTVEESDQTSQEQKIVTEEVQHYLSQVEHFNVEALQKIRRHMPVNIRHMSEEDLTNTPTPNEKFLPKAIAKKFKQTNVLQLLRINPDDIERMHPSTLINLRVIGLTLTERRALHLHLKSVFPIWEKKKAEKLTARKWTWYTMMENNFKENHASWVHHVEQYGPPENHVGCRLYGNCPIKADLLVDYNNDYGFSAGDEYGVIEVRKPDTHDRLPISMYIAPQFTGKSKALVIAGLELEEARKEKASKRYGMMKMHYKGKHFQASKAIGSCEAMDESMDKMENHILKWLEIVIIKGDNPSDDDKKKEVARFSYALNELKLTALDFAERSGMQTSGKEKSGDEADEDPRSSVEAALSEEVYECSQEFLKFIKDRMKTMDVKDIYVEKAIELLEGLFDELHTRNVNTLSKIGGERPDKSRNIKKVKDLRKEVEDKMIPKEEAQPAEEAPRPMGLPPGAGGRGDLLSRLRGRGRGGRGGGRGDLLSAMAGRGRGPQEEAQPAPRPMGLPPGAGGRGDLMSALQGRGRGGRGGGRRDLLSAIAGRSKGRAAGGDAGGRGGLNI